MAQFKCWACKEEQTLPAERKELKGRTIVCPNCGADVKVRTVVIKKIITLLVWGDGVALVLLTLGLIAQGKSGKGFLVFFGGGLISVVGALLVYGVSYAASKATHHDLSVLDDFDRGWGPFPPWPTD